ncbi:HEPN domain-containing protein [[Flexibacter] sp. ATCC 35208]|uniref:HEPN domain-containing protein n=1 Tax=[Flexibacter] sp. ATCC 35208 TaxID=1936242 RepID=UPI0009CC9AC1|nr:HEPN domain-containing protein [[Flexibacter] sp. ATCC 35208]OMP75752.1 hypothetical protein BW716_28365 [[Flexibacter] sp. ATCC 35208]
MTKQEYKTLTYRPTQMESNGVGKPHEALEVFFSDFTVEDCRKRLWELYSHWIINHERQGTEHNEASTILLFYTHTEMLIEAAYLLYNKKKRKDAAKEAAPLPEIPVLKPDETLVSITPDETLQQVIQAIVKEALPERIFLINPISDGQSGENLQLELMVLLPETASKPFDEYHNSITAACKDMASVKILIRKAQEVYSFLQQGHIFYSVVCTDKALVYSINTVPLPVPEHLPVAEIREKAYKTFEQDTPKCEAFIDGARYYLLTKKYGIAAFMLQQVVEHLLRAVIASLMNRNVFTHNLTSLLQTCRLCAKEITTVFPRDTDKEKEFFQLLNTAYVKARYTNDYEIGEYEVSILLERVEYLQFRAKEVCTKKIEAFGQSVKSSITQ